MSSEKASKLDNFVEDFKHLNVESLELSDEGFERLSDAINTPSEPTQALKDLMARPKRWVD